MNNTIGIILGVTSILGTIVTIITILNLLRFKVDDLTEKEKDLKTALKEISASMNSTVTHIGVVVAEQGVINKFNINLLDTLNRKMEEQAKAQMEHTLVLNDHTVVITMIRELIKFEPQRNITK